MQNRIPYNAEAIYVGPSPASGYTFMRYYDGFLNGDHTNLIINENLLLQVDRVQNVSYGIDTSRTEIKQLGKKGLVAYPNINPPNIRLDFEYLLNGVINDARIGLNVNYAQFDFPNSGAPKYSDNFQVSLLSGLLARQLTRPTATPFFPAVCRDNRNVFLVRCNETEDLHWFDKERFTEPDRTQPGADPRVTGFQVLAFGNCYLDSYNTEGAVNLFPRSRVSYVCENVSFYLSGSGCNIPAVNTQTREIVNTNKFVIPTYFDEGGAHILHPGDIILTINSSGDGLSGLGIDFNNIFITDYDISMNFNREPLSSLGFELPLDRQVNLPVYADLTFGMTVGDTTSGHFIDLLNIDSGYNVTIRLRNPLCDSPFVVVTGNPRHGGPVLSGEGLDAIRYDFRDAKFMGINYTTTIGRNKSANLNFRTEIDPDVTGRGFYISGLLGISKIENYLLYESGGGLAGDDGGFLLYEDSGVIPSDLKVLF